MELLWDLKTVNNCTRTGPESTKNATIDDQLQKLFRDPKTMWNCPQNSAESANTHRLNDWPVIAPRGLSTVEIALGHQIGE